MGLRDKFFFSSLYLLRMNSDCPRYDLPDGYTIHKLVDKDIQIVAAVHRSEEIVEQRIEREDIAYWIRHNDACINIQWYSIRDYYVWDIRSMVSFPHGASYLYDGFTDPAYRGKGLNKGALSRLIFDAGLLSKGPIFSLTQKSNPMGWGFLERFGFLRTAEISLLQVPPLRIYTITQHDVVNRHVVFMKVRTEPLRIDLDSIRIVN